MNSPSPSKGNLDNLFLGSTATTFLRGLHSQGRWESAPHACDWVYLMADATAADPSVGVWEQLHCFFFVWSFPSLRTGSGLAPAWRRRLRTRARLPSQPPTSKEETVELLPRQRRVRRIYFGLIALLLRNLGIFLRLVTSTVSFKIWSTGRSKICSSVCGWTCPVGPNSSPRQCPTEA